MKSKVNKSLPEGWKWVKLSEVCHVNPRRPILSYSDNENVSFVPMEAVDQTSGSISDVQVKTFGEVKKGYTYFEENDVLFAKITPCMQNGKHAIARNLINKFGFGTTEFHVLRPLEGTLPELIWFYVRQPYILIEATNHFTGAVGQQRVPKEFLIDLPIPLPPLPEQKRIASKLNEQMASIDKARKAAEEQLNTINAIPASILRKAFNGEL